MEIYEQAKSDLCGNSSGEIDESQNERLSRTPSVRSLSIRDLGDMPEPHEMLSVSAVLYYCKRKILNPYQRLLTLMGLRPFNSGETSPVAEILWMLYTLQVLLFVICGYILQYMACFRRDIGFCYEQKHIYETYWDTLNNIECKGSSLFNYITPSIIHFITYLYAIFLFRFSNESLSTLMERVFLSSSNPSDGSISQKKLVKQLWFFTGVSIVWMILSLISVILMMAAAEIRFKWIDEESSYMITGMKILLTICTLWHDVIQATIITSYCLQGQLLTSYLYFLRAKLILQPVRPIEWMKELLEFKKLLRYFNNDLAPAVCLFTIINLSWSIVGVCWLLNYEYIEMMAKPKIGIYILNTLLWLCMTIVPFVQAARLTAACSMIREVGHEVRTRPYAHQETSNEELDSVLLYTSSLRMSAKIFCIPITGKYLCIALTLTALFILTTGQLRS